MDFSILDFLFNKSQSFIEQNAVLIEDVVYVPVFDFMEVFSMELLESSRLISFIVDASFVAVVSSLCAIYVLYRTYRYDKKMRDLDSSATE